MAKNEQNKEKIAEAVAENKPEDNKDVIDESANTNIYPADLGTSLTSYGDGSASISPQYVERREEVAKHNEDVDRDNRAIAKKLGLLKD